MLYFKTLWEDLKRQKEIKKRFYKDVKFRLIDQALLSAYYLQGPFKISKQFLQERGEEDVHLYGETPLLTFDAIAKICNLGKHDTLLELGCGRGRGLFFLSHFYGCKVVGIEQIPKFIELGKKLAKKCGLNIDFRQKNFLEADLSSATVIYLYGTCLTDDEILHICRRFETLPPSVKIVTISYPLSDYFPFFSVEKSFPVTFPWGDTTGYLQSVKRT